MGKLMRPGDLVVAIRNDGGFTKPGMVATVVRNPSHEEHVLLRRDEDTAGWWLPPTAKLESGYWYRWVAKDALIRVGREDE